jgi:peroxiredoxin
MQKTLEQTLAEIRAGTGGPLDALNDELVVRLVNAETANHALKAGDACPDIALPSAEGRFVRIRTLLETGPLVICFYRGRWCPYCSAELEALHEAGPAISAKGGTLIAITPEAGGVALNVKRERGFGFDILCDLDNGAALTFGLVFRLPADLEALFRSVNFDLAKVYDNDSWFLPIPATYIIGRDGVVAHAYVNPDFRHRLDPVEVIRVLSELP